ncbi:MAG: DUF6513 domain-containing protein [Firmicutes bacterium]|nr:DUF6513 domain-containing protein [Bacillota bacterium]
MSKKLFVTGRLAAKALEQTLSSMNPDFSYEIQVLPITVAALMNVDFMVKHLRPGSYDSIIIPGSCQGNLLDITNKFGAQVIRGPKNLRELPSFFGHRDNIDGYGEYSVKIIAEIVDAPLLSTQEIIERAEYYRQNGADIIDLGCCPNHCFAHLSEVISELKRKRFLVSIDTFNPNEILTAQAAGVDLVLSINSSNMEIASKLTTKVVVVPDFGQGLESLEKNVQQLSELAVDFIIDPVLDPINFGFVESLERYYQIRKKYPEKEMMMGLGNVSELTDADSTGINALLMGIATELNIDYVLTTEASNRTKGVVREADIARKIMYFSQQQGILPKRIDNRLLTVKDREVSVFSESQLKEMQSLVRDSNYRIFVGNGDIYLFNKQHFLKGRDIDRLFAQIEIKNSRHAFYLGKELNKAKIAAVLGKRYGQDEELNWGFFSDWEG